MFWVWNERSTDTENELWIDFTVGVVLGVEQVNIEVCNFPFTVWHANSSLDGSDCCAWFTKVGPLNVFVGEWASCERSTFHVLWEDEWTRCDEQVFFFFSVDPFNNAFVDELLEGHLAGAEGFEVFTGQTRCTVVEDQQRSQDTSLVGVDEDVLVLTVVSDGNFRRDGSTSASGLEVANQVLSVLVDTVNVTVDVNTVTRGPVVWFEDIKFIELLSNFNFADVFGDVNHLCGVLHKSTVLTFRGLVRAQAAPLCRVQVTCFEVRLASNQRRCYTAHVR